jgi:hypothetical protein
MLSKDGNYLNYPQSHALIGPANTISSLLLRNSTSDS